MLLLLGLPLHAANCLDYGEPEVILSKHKLAVTESSGLAPSWTRSGVWFTHDDSGGEPEIFAFLLDGTDAGIHPVPDVVPADWEDMSAGPCPEHVQGAAGATRCLYIGDVGDNFLVRTWATVYVVPEPGQETEAPVLEQYEATWPEGARDCEALLVHPLTGRIYLVSKTGDGPSEVARYPTAPGDEDSLSMEAVASLDLAQWGSTTGGDWDPDGERVVIRTYGNVLVWNTDPCDPDAHWEREPDFVIPVSESQGEAVAFSLDGSIITSSEGSPMQVSRIECVGYQGPADPCEVDTGEAEEPRGSTTSAEDGCGCRPKEAALFLPIVALSALGSRRRR